MASAEEAWPPARKGGHVTLAGRYVLFYRSTDDVLVKALRTPPSESVRISGSKVSADLTHGKLHLASRGEAVDVGWTACLDQKLCKVRVEIRADRPRVDYRFGDHGLEIRVRVVAVAEELVEDHADREQVGGRRPSGSGQ